MELTRNQLIRSLMRLKKIARPVPLDGDLRSVEMFTLHYFAMLDCHKEQEKGPASDVQHLQHILHVSKPAVSQILNGLEAKGYITRGIDTTDRRRIEVKVTASGAAVLKESKAQMDDMVDVLIKRFGVEETQQLITLLNGLADAYETLKSEMTTTGEREN